MKISHTDCTFVLPVGDNDLSNDGHTRIPPSAYMNMVLSILPHLSRSSRRSAASLIRLNAACIACNFSAHLEAAEVIPDTLLAHIKGRPIPKILCYLATWIYKKNSFRSVPYEMSLTIQDSASVWQAQSPSGQCYLSNLIWLFGDVILSGHQDHINIHFVVIVATAWRPILLHWPYKNYVTRQLDHLMKNWVSHTECYLRFLLLDLECH